MRTPSRSAVAICLVAAATLSACAQGAGSSPQESSLSREPIPLRSAEVLASDGAPVTGEVPEAILSAILADAADRTGADPDEISVSRGEAVTWTDGSLGCPEPDMSYTQALVDGYHVVLDAAGEPLDYRVDSSGGFRICSNPSRPSG